MKRLEERLAKFGIMPGLERTQRICEALGRPQDCLETILVTGTNGKGSVTAALSSILTEAGHRTGAYYSPHISKYNERYKIDGKEITDEDFLPYEDMLLKLHDEGYEMTVFEALTAIAFRYFAERGCRYAVMEIGMGGQFDATNIANECASIITNAGLEHSEYLGKTVQEIARDKAHIIKKPGSVAVTGCTGQALAEVSARCQSVNARLKALDSDFSVRLKEARTDSTVFDYSGKNEFGALRISLAGRHQAKNAALAVAMAEELGVGEEMIRGGLAKTKHPGRLQIICREPLVVADGAHNPDGIRALVESMDIYPREKLVCVFSALKDKDYREMLSILAPICDEIIVNQIKSERAAPADEIAAAAKEYTKTQVVPDIASSVRLAKRKAGKKGMVLICGSLYMLGEAMLSGRW
ncbi:MAG: folylpolyglutamate synthase/dihydrofolate synthase family protein [Candidatus Micrarchaeota archaeon]